MGFIKGMVVFMLLYFFLVSGLLVVWSFKIFFNLMLIKLVFGE